jgi:hypothetical protein
MPAALQRQAKIISGTRISGPLRNEDLPEDERTQRNSRLTQVWYDVFHERGTQSAMRRFRTPAEIQRFLNRLKYRREGGALSPLIVETTRLANCFDGAVYAAAALEKLGYPPLIVDLVAKNDDDHVIAVYHSGGWGAIAKSNTTILRFREPVYRSIRELVMSYFDGYFNTAGYKSLRAYSAPVNLRRFDAIAWRTTEIPLDPLQDWLYRIRHYSLITRQMERTLARADADVMRACFLFSDRKGLFRPRRA